MKRIFLLIGLVLTLTLSGQKAPAGIIASQKATASAPAEMLTNGVLTSGTSWGQTGGFTLTGNAATFDDVTNGTIFQLNGDMAIPIQPSTSYTLTFDLTGTSGGGIYMAITSTATGDGAVTYYGFTDYTDGSKTIAITTPASINDGGLRFSANTAGDSGGTIDNISLKLAP